MRRCSECGKFIGMTGCEDHPEEFIQQFTQAVYGMA